MSVGFLFISNSLLYLFLLNSLSRAGKVVSEFQSFEATEAGKSKAPNKDLIGDYKKFSMATDKKLEKVC
jgi:hypothetical protein